MVRQRQRRPNVLLVLTDDQGYGDLSCTGNPVLRTPAIDRLAKESVQFTDFHVCPMCTPTRAEIMTGRDALRTGATYVCMGRSLMRADLPTIADIFAANGYATGHFGKWHLGDNYPYRPHDRGFHESVWHPGFGITSAPDFFGNDYFDDVYRHRERLEQYHGYCTDVWFNEAIRWMERCIRNGDPFFTYIATNAPHGPLWVPDRYRDPYRHAVEADEASFFAMIANIDENMARLEAFLAGHDLAEDTILIFMTDNGTATGDRIFNAGMRGNKTSLYEGGHRVPCFIRWPEGGIGGRTSADGTRIGTAARATDIAPTLIDLCDLVVDDGVTFDGISIAGLARGRTDPMDPRVFDRMSVVQYGHLNANIDVGFAGKDVAAVLWNRWRLVQGRELYDVVTDPGQARDIASHHPETLARMRGYYDEWWDEAGPYLERYQRLVIGSPEENPMRLCSPDWAWAYADNQWDIRAPRLDSGVWHVDVASDGRYALSLRRWPKESELAIASGAPRMIGVDGTLRKGAALPVASAWLRAGTSSSTQAIRPDATEIRFELTLRRGPTEIQSWWIDAEGRRLAGAYYLTAERLA